MTSCTASSESPVPAAEAAHSALETLIPAPASVTAGEGVFTLTAETRIYVDATPEVSEVGFYLAEALRPATGYALPVIATTPPPPPGHVLLTTQGADVDPALGEEGYVLSVSTQGATLTAHRPAGLFWGVQTLRQLLPPSIERTRVQPGPWKLPACTIRDEPRFAWRGLMLDVARHFFTVEEVKRYIDLMARYKMNRLHLHLTDDQGWRIMIRSWPRLAEHGGSTAVGGGEGGFYTQEAYAALVDYAQQRHITLVPEIDLPGHTNAALASYPELNCDGQAPDLYTGTEVGFSSLCIDKELTFTFVDDVIGELAALTPGPYIHIGGDEAHATESADYVTFIERVQNIVQAHGKTMIGWEEIAQSALAPRTVVQHWHSEEVLAAAQDNAVILSPATHVYLDMKYHPETPLGLDWAGHVDVQQAYAWDPATEVPAVTARQILGIEAAVWTETLATPADLDFMALQRLLGHAEIGWSPQEKRDWAAYRERLSAHGPRLDTLGVNFYRSPQVGWQP